MPRTQRATYLLTLPKCYSPSQTEPGNVPPRINDRKPNNAKTQYKSIIMAEHPTMPQHNPSAREPATPTNATHAVLPPPDHQHEHIYSATPSPYLNNPRPTVAIPHEAAVTDYLSYHDLLPMSLHLSSAYQNRTARPLRPQPQSWPQATPIHSAVYLPNARTPSQPDTYDEVISPIPHNHARCPQIKS